MKNNKSEKRKLQQLAAKSFNKFLKEVTSGNSDGYEKVFPLLRHNDHLPSRNAPSR